MGQIMAWWQRPLWMEILLPDWLLKNCVLKPPSPPALWLWNLVKIVFKWTQTLNPEMHASFQGSVFMDTLLLHDLVVGCSAFHIMAPQQVKSNEKFAFATHEPMALKYRNPIKKWNTYMTYITYIAYTHYIHAYMHFMHYMHTCIHRIHAHMHTYIQYMHTYITCIDYMHTHIYIHTCITLHHTTLHHITSHYITYTTCITYIAYITCITLEKSRNLVPKSHTHMFRTKIRFEWTLALNPEMHAWSPGSVVMVTLFLHDFLVGCSAFHIMASTCEIQWKNRFCNMESMALKWSKIDSHHGLHMWNPMKKLFFATWNPWPWNA